MEVSMEVRLCSVYLMISSKLHDYKQKNITLDLLSLYNINTTLSLKKQRDKKALS